MNSRLLLALGGLLASTSSATMNLNLLTEYVDSFGSVCLDGTPGAYYLEKAATPSSKWMVFFEGGGWCYNDKDCANRATGGLGSSSSYGPTADRVGGVGSADCDINPAFCDFNFVYLKYCDGNSFSGAREGTVHVDETDQDLHFRGHYILEAVLTDLVAKQGMGSVTELVLSGCSAGGLSTFLHSDFVEEYVQTLVSHDFKYGAVPVSGFFLMNRQNVHDEFVMASQMQTIFSLSNATVGVHQGCVSAAAAGEEWLCNTAPGALQHIQAPIYPLDSSFDSWQSGCILTSTFIDYDGTSTRDMPNGQCSAAPGFEACGGDVTECDAEQIYSVIEYQGSFVRLLTNAQGYQKADSGAFIYPCFTHCAGQDDASYTGFTVGGVTMNEAVRAWWEEAVAVEGGVAKNYLSDMYNIDDGSNPNQTC